MMLNYYVSGTSYCISNGSMALYVISGVYVLVLCLKLFILLSFRFAKKIDFMRWWIMNNSPACVNESVKENEFKMNKAIDDEQSEILKVNVIDIGVNTCIDVHERLLASHEIFLCCSQILILIVVSILLPLFVYFNIFHGIAVCSIMFLFVSFLPFINYIDCMFVFRRGFVLLYFLIFIVMINLITCSICNNAWVMIVIGVFTFSHILRIALSIYKDFHVYDIAHLAFIIIFYFIWMFAVYDNVQFMRSIN